MGQKDKAKQLKAFAKKREQRSSVESQVPSTSERERLRVECLGIVTDAILRVRELDPKLRDSVVLEALRYECREPGVTLSASNAVHAAMEASRREKQYDTQVWRAALKALLAMSAPANTPNRSPTQLLDLLETVAR